jgi:hypothetical protein
MRMSRNYASRFVTFSMTGFAIWFALQTPSLLFQTALSQSAYKEEIISRLISLEETIDQLREKLASSPNDKSLATRLNDAFAAYDNLSAQLGGDRPPAQPNREFPSAIVSPTIAPAAPPGCTATTTSFINTTPVPILDFATVTATIVVAGADAYLLDVDLTTSITHAFPSDLDITLTSPAGTVVTITTDTRPARSPTPRSPIMSSRQRWCPRRRWAPS